MTFAFVLPDGSIVSGPVRGAGGMVTSRAVMEHAYARACIGKPIGRIYEPRMGHVAVYPDACAAGDGRPVVVPMSRWVVDGE